MSESVRQSRLFAAEDYKKVFKAYSFIDYTAYDFDTLKEALINYIRTYYPEDFNDYIESSEFIAIIELLAYFGTSLAFRTDLNSRENFIDTAERRESIIRLAQMVNYVPRRNIAASGLFKVSAVETDQPLVDANGIDINDTTIFWNDPNNPDWFDQFIQICNAAFNTVNPFGRPTKSGVIGGIPTDLYQLNNILRLAVTYPITVSINGQQYPIDICNPDFVTNQTIFERDPDPANAFNLIYRNDALGVGSSNTGFFLYFKQGTLNNIDTNFEFPVPNRIFPLGLENINQDDVYVQETDQEGNVINKWARVPALAGENIIYNSIQFAERNIFSAISGTNDTVTVRFADGNFGNVPTGLFRFWVRTSANEALVIRPESVQGLQINIPYIGVDQQTYTLRITFNLEQTISNAAPTETDDQIRLRAPEVFSTQSRMVNGSDYNVLPLIYGNQIAKIQATNRTYSGQSRYLDLNDPTGFHRDLIIFGQDGALFRENQNVLEEVVRDSANAANINLIIATTIQSMLRDPRVSQFFFDEYLRQFEQVVRVNPTIDQPTGRSLLDLVPTSNDASDPLFWKTSPFKFKNDTGYFSASTALPPPAPTAETLVNTLDTDNIPGSVYQPWAFIRSGAVLEIEGSGTVRVNNIVQSGQPIVLNPANEFANVGPVELGKEVKENAQVLKVYPIFRNVLNSAELDELLDAVTNGISFWIYYDLLTDTWSTSTTVNPDGDSINFPWQYAPVNPGEIYSTWENYPTSGLIYVNIETNNQSGTVTYSLTARGRTYVFESYRDVRFYWQPDQIVIDTASGQALRDNIEIMPAVNTNSTIDNNLPPEVGITDSSTLTKGVKFNLSGVYIQEDGYQDPTKVQVSLVDNDSDGIPDDPTAFDRIISVNDRVVFEYYSNEVTGYQTTRPWISRWNTELLEYTGQIYVYFPEDITTGRYDPFISPNSSENILSPSEDAIFMNSVDLLFLNNENQLVNITDAITQKFNTDPQLTIDDINLFFIRNKSYLINSVPGFGDYRTVEFQLTEDPLYPAGRIIIPAIDRFHFDRNGKPFTQNTSIPEDERLPLYFKWSHYAPLDQRVDPSPSNIIDMIVITEGYYRDVLIWKNLNTTINLMPKAPTTEELRIQFQDLDKYKMVSDAIVWNSGEFKVLFGPQAAPELQATFKVVKAPTTNISDNEVKTRVVQAIDTYFDIRNWDFGEKFFYTELAAFIHQQLSRIISSVVIVPNNANSQFGNLFEIISNSNQLFISTATVNNVQIVSNLTEQNLRV